MPTKKTLSALLGNELRATSCAQICAKWGGIPLYRTDRRGHQLFEQDIGQHATTLRILFGAEDVRARVGACLLTGRAMISFSIEEKLRSRGFFELLGTELDSVETREFALRALVDILHGAGHSAKMGVRSALAKACGRQLIELVLVLEGQGLVCALDLLLMAASSPKPGFRAESARVLDAIMGCLKRPLPYASPIRYRVLLELSTLVVEHDYKAAVAAHQETLLFLVGLVRFHPDLFWRTRSFMILRSTFNKSSAQPTSSLVSEDEEGEEDGAEMAMPSSSHEWAGKVDKAFHDALSQAEEDGDWLKLGVQLARLLDLYPTLCFSLHREDHQNPLHQLPTSKTCITDDHTFAPIQKAIAAHDRAYGHRSFVSSLLRMKTFSGAGHSAEVYKIGQQHLAHHDAPHSSAFYLYMAQSSTRTKHQRQVHEFIQKGLDSSPSDFLRCILLSRQISHSVSAGFYAASGPAVPAPGGREESSAFLRRAYDSYRPFLDSTPIDFEDIGRALHELNAMVLIFGGPELSLDLKELGEVNAFVGKAKAFWKSLPPERLDRQQSLQSLDDSPTGRAVQVVAQLSTAAAEEWSAALGGESAGLPVARPGVGIPELGIGEGCCPECGDHVMGEALEKRMVELSIGGAVALSMCDGCYAITSSKLLTCGGCRKAKYCSTSCQKHHYRVHKEFCKAG